MQETWVWSLGWEDPLEKGMTTHSSILAWEIPWTEQPGWLQSIGLQRVGHYWATKHTHTHTHTHTHHTTHTHTHTHTHTRAQGVGYDSSWAAITGTDRFIRYLQTTSRRKWKVKLVLQLERAKLVSKSGVSKPIPCDKKFLVWKLSNSIPKFKPNRKKISESKSGILRHYFN